jgi:hypothetical protein
MLHRVARNISYAGCHFYLIGRVCIQIHDWPKGICLVFIEYLYIIYPHDSSEAIRRNLYCTERFCAFVVCLYSRCIHRLNKYDSYFCINTYMNCTVFRICSFNSRSNRIFVKTRNEYHCTQQKSCEYFFHFYLHFITIINCNQSNRIQFYPPLYKCQVIGRFMDSRLIK